MLKYEEEFKEHENFIQIKSVLADIYLIKNNKRKAELIYGLGCIPETLEIAKKEGLCVQQVEYGGSYYFSLSKLDKLPQNDEENAILLGYYKYDPCFRHIYRNRVLLRIRYNNVTFLSQIYVKETLDWEGLMDYADQKIKLFGEGFYYDIWEIPAKIKEKKL